MGFEPNVVDQLVALTRRRFPEWTGFDDPTYLQEERDYKVAAVGKAIGAEGLLLEPALRSDLEGRAFQSFIDRFDSVGRTNLLYQSVPLSGDLNALYLARDSEPEVFERFCMALYDLLWGPGASPARLQRYVDAASADGLPVKWTTPTYFLFVTHPDEDIFVKPRIMRRVAKELALPWAAKGQPSGDEYAAILAWCTGLRDALANHGARDMIDIQSMLWVAGSEMAGNSALTATPGESDVSKQRHWKIAPGQGARLWDTWRDQGHASVGWAELGDLSEMAPDEWPHHRDEICAQHGWKAAGADQSWHFAKDIRAGDRVVANHGTSEVLGFGTVVGGYYFVPGEEHAHRIPVEWDDTRTRRLAEADHGWQRTLLELTEDKFNALVALPVDLDLVPAAEQAFTEAARDLLVAMAAEPTRAFYTAHKDPLAKLVQEPVKSLLLAVGERVEPAVKDALETEKRLFSIFPKNDFGRGGAWPYYWGAFYPAGGKKSQGCQLYVSLDDGGFSYGFSIGNYASDDRRRFARNIDDSRDALVGALADTIAAPDFDFGSVNESQGGNITKGVTGLGFAEWLDEVSTVGPQVHVVVPWPKVLATERSQLVNDVVAAFDRLFPLVLLCTLDDPMPAIHDYLEGVVPEEDEELNPSYTLDDLSAETSLPRENLQSWLRAIARKGQAILYGPPGTGKTYVAERLAKHLVAGGTGISELVQFHPAYAYEDFMQGMRPKARDGGGLDYPIVDGRFKQFCQQARGRKGLSVLVIDEVNRANLARVFGELMYLLEYRDKSIPLAAGGSFSIPGNVRIIGTMNTADRSIALVDHALRRRFAFLPLYPDYQMLTNYHAKKGSGYDPAKLVEVLKDLNRKIGDHHYEVGTSFFMRPDIAEQLPDVWSMEIEPYLEEYFFDQRATVDSFRWDEVKKKLGAE